MKLQILHKGLFLIFIPLLLQLVFFNQLFSLVNQVEKLEREQASRAIMMVTVDQIVMEFGLSWTTMICKLFGSKGYTLDPEGYKARVDPLFARLRSMTKEFPEAGALLDEAQKTSQAQCDFYKEMLAAGGAQDGDSQMQILSYVKLRPKFISITNRGVVLKQMLQQEVSALTDSWHKNENKRVSLKQLLFIGVAADFTVTVLFLLAFLGDITKRLKVLVANAELIPSGKALNERVSGSDELAMLDGVLHDASEELASAKEYRKSLMEMVAHDLRSPLSSAKSTVDILLNPAVYGSGEKSLAHLARLRRNIVQLIGFVEDLLTIDRLESGKLELELELFKIHSIVDECFDSLSVKAQGRGIKLLKAGDDSEVIADQARLTQVVMNLLGNAIKHSPDGSIVKVFTEHDEDTVKLSVIDQGRGIAPAEQERIFQKFVQSKDAKQKEGFGLGLAICKLIIDAHQGTIGLKSELGKGSEFWFTLPGDQED